MTRWLLRSVTLAVLIAAGYWLWNIFFPNPEHVIRKRFEAIARTASFSTRESGIAKFDNATRLAAFCAVCLITTPGLGFAAVAAFGLLASLAPPAPPREPATAAA